MKVFLDDVRHPQEAAMYMHQRIGPANPIYLQEWEIVRDYEEFKRVITIYMKDITHVSFDHDLAEIHYDPATWTESFVYKEETGYDCAKWMKKMYELAGRPLPIMYVHSMNPVGTERIINLFKK